MLKGLLKKLLTVGKWLLVTVLVLVVGVIAFTSLHPTFGGKPDAHSMEKIKASKQFDGDIFKNLEPTVLDLQPVEAVPEDQEGSLWTWMFPPKGKNPINPLPSVPVNTKALKNGEFIWFGHSTVLFKTADKVIMTDPVFNNASPIPATVNAFAMQHTPNIADLPQIDAVLISHDHYDHLDAKAVQDMNAKVSHFYVPLGIKAHLQRWGIADSKITELDWYDEVKMADVRLVLTPSRHFSGRGLTNRNTTLWSSWVVKSANLSVFFSGDSGYGKHYAEIGKRFAPFDIAFMEDGQYNPRWPEVHMMPEQSVQATVELGAKRALPIHWAKFDLAPHHWKDPILRFKKAAQAQGITTVHPKIGETFTLNDDQLAQQPEWWTTTE